MLLSILMPSYDNVCTGLTKKLCQQASAIHGIEFEILVADDGGKDENVKTENNKINDFPGCKYIVRKHNVGRAAIRNVLANKAKGDWLLFLDSDISVLNDNFVKAYTDSIGMADVVCGGVEMSTIAPPKGNLRYKYEQHESHNHTAEKRNSRPYQAFRTTNFMISKEVKEKVRFDERFRGYGYEDVMYGKNLKEQGLTIAHIDNPVTYTKFEDNATYLMKIREAMTTLSLFSNELQGYSPLLATYTRLQRKHIDGIVKCIIKLLKPLITTNLTHTRPSLALFKLYKMGCLMEAMSKKN